MRVTSATRVATYQSILNAARRLLLERGWNGTTTRGIAEVAGIAGGTLFNYFPSKEAVAAALLREALQAAEQVHQAHRRGDEALEEALFGWIWTQFRHLEPYRAVLASAQAAIFPPLATGKAEPGGAFLRQLQLRRFTELVAGYGLEQALSPVLLQLCWTLYLGVLAHWAADRSPHQEDTLALLDQSLILFCSALNQSSSVRG